MILSWS